MENKSILIYDNEKEILTITRLILETEYQQIETCLTWERLFEDIERVKPHLIIMDIRTPYFGGVHAIEMLHENEKTKNIPVIVFSTSNNIQKISRKIQATACIEKPFDIHELRQIVRDNIG